MESEDPKSQMKINIGDALYDENMLLALRNRVTPAIEEHITELIKKWGPCRHGKGELLTICMGLFKKVLIIYMKNGHHLKNDITHFSQYFTWHARQEFVRHMKECTQSQKVHGE